MGLGYCGAIARVCLSTGRTSVEHPDEQFYRTYMGGRNIISYYLLREVSGDVDAFSEENLLVFATGVTTGAPFPGNSRYSIGAKSPLTGGYAETEAGGFWGPALKAAGFDAIVVEGRSDKPVFLLVSEGRVDIRDAGSLWGCSTTQTETLLREQLEDMRAQVACIGPAGEKLVRFASVHHDASRAVNGRLGLGAVMGSKRLKAVVAQGSPQELRFASPEVIKEKSSYFARHFRSNGPNEFLHTTGTWGGLAGLSGAGILPTRNFQEGSFKEMASIAGPGRDPGVLTARHGCYACPVACRKDTLLRGEPVSAPEYESAAALGSNCGVTDEATVVEANRLCNELGMDSISAGGCIAFAMECCERGLIDPSVVPASRLSFGDAESVLQLLRDIASREAMGELLADGVKRASQRIGGDAEKLAIHVKGEECAMHEPRGKVGVGLGYAVGPKGGDHIEMEHDECFSSPTSDFLADLRPLGWSEVVSEGDTDHNKVAQFKVLQLVWGIYAVLDICVFTVAPGRTLKLTDVVDLVRASTGWNTTLYELMLVSQRGVNMARAFNVKCGKDAHDDGLPLRFHTPLKESGAALASDGIPRERFQEMVKEYYRAMNWDDRGIPTRGALCELGLRWVSDLLDCCQAEPETS